jgi:hypothetical protein
MNTLSGMASSGVFKILTHYVDVEWPPARFNRRERGVRNVVYAYELPVHLDDDRLRTLKLFRQPEVRQKL